MQTLGEDASGIWVIGRSAELERVDAFLDRSASGPAALVIHGEPGIGKTSVWRAALERASDPDRAIRVLRAAPAEAERALTLGGLTDLLAEVGTRELTALPGVQRHALEVALLRAEASGQLPDQRTLSVATAGLLRDLAGSRPLLIAIDDAQWLDDSSTAVLAYAVRRLSDRPVGVLLAVRGTPSVRTHELVAGLAPERCEQLALGPMPLAGLHQLFLARLGRSFPRLALVRIEEASGGNPFYALEIGRELAASAASLAPGAQLPIPESLGSLLEARIEALPPATRHVLLLAAISTSPTVESLAAAGPDADASLEAALAPAVHAGIVSTSDGVIRFGHPLLAQAVIQTTSPAALRRAHAALARAATSDEARARHLAGATEGRDERVAAALEAAATAARNRGATLDAAALYQRAAAMTPDSRPDDALRRATLAGECLLVDVSEMVDSDAILATAIDAGRPGPLRAIALSLRALTRYYHGDLRAAVRLADQAIEEAGVEESRAGASSRARETRAVVLGRAAFIVMQVDLPRGAGLASEGLQLAEGLPDIDRDVLGNLLLLDASARFGLAEGVEHDEIERGRSLLTATGRSWEHDGISGLDFGLARATDDLDRAIAMTEALIAEKSGPGGDDPFNLVMLSELQLRRGDTKAARASAEAADEGYGREGGDVYPAWRLRGLALVAAQDGRHADATRWSTEGLRLAEQAGDLIQQLYHHQILGFVDLTTGAHEAANRHLGAAAALARRIGSLHPGRFRLDGDRLDVALALGDLEQARAIVAGLDHANARAATPWTRAVGARARGLLQAADGDLEAAAASLEAALLAHDALPSPFERGRTLLALGQVHRRRKAKRLADERLREAIEVFEGVDAPAWADRARAELARVGLRPRAPADLTVTERRVAELAATGLSSREIAERAFLAPKTVGNVLGRVYEKLGIHSRAELGARLGARVGRGRTPSGTANANEAAAGDRSG